MKKLKRTGDMIDHSLLRILLISPVRIAWFSAETWGLRLRAKIINAFIGRFGVPSAFSVWLVSASESSKITMPLIDRVHYKCSTTYLQILPRFSTGPHMLQYFRRRSPIEILARRVALSEWRGDRHSLFWKDMGP